MKIAEQLPIAIHLAIEAGKAIMIIYNQFSAEISNYQTSQEIENYLSHSASSIFIKEDQSPVTIADLTAHQIIVDGLKKTLIPVISEEAKEQLKTPIDSKYIWLVDPLDGTKEYIKKNGEFTVNIALLEENKPCLGVVYAPALGLLYFAEKERGSFKMENIFLVDDFKMENAQQIKASKPADTIYVAGSRNHLNHETQQFIEQLKINHSKVEISSIGSSLKFCLIAEGKMDIYPRLGPTMEWDTAAAEVVLKEAGGKVIQFENHRPMKYNKANLLNPWFLALNNNFEEIS